LSELPETSKSTQTIVKKQQSRDLYQGTKQTGGDLSPFYCRKKIFPKPSLTTTHRGCLAAKLANKVVRMAKHHHHTNTFSFYISEIKGFGLREEERLGASFTI
jgi:hypothetical protein